MFKYKFKLIEIKLKKFSVSVFWTGGCSLAPCQRPAATLEGEPTSV